MDYSFIRDRINSENSNNYILSILLSKDGFYFYIAGKDSINDPMYILSKQVEKPGMDNLAAEFENFRDFDNLIFHKSMIIIHTEAFNLIPEEFYTPENHDEYLYLSHIKNDPAITYLSEDSELKIKIIFNVPGRLNDLINSKFPHSKIIHSACPSLHFGYKKSEQSCIVYHFGTSISVAVFDKKELRFFNVFPVQNENDLVYYIILAMRSCNMLTRSTILYFMGVKDKDSLEYNMISRHIAKPVGYSPCPGQMDELNFPVNMLFNNLEGLYCES